MLANALNLKRNFFCLILVSKDASYPVTGCCCCCIAVQTGALKNLKLKLYGCNNVHCNMGYGCTWLNVNAELLVVDDPLEVVVDENTTVVVCVAVVVVVVVVEDIAW